MIGAVDAVPALVTQAAQRTERLERGVVGVRIHRVLDVHAGPYHRHEEMEMAAIYQDGRLLKVRVISQSVNGKDTDDATKSQTVQRYEHPAPGDVFARPFDPQHTSEYSFAPPQGQMVRFHALVCDGGHGDGTFTVDGSDDVVSVEYTPCKLPQYSRAGTIDIVRSAVLPDYWAPTQEQQHYSGRYAIFGGGAECTIKDADYIRFASASAALEALDANRV